MQSIEEMPNIFVTAMRSLFDVLDPGKSGFIRFTDIELRWDESSIRDLPCLPGDVLNSLRKVQTQSGLLSFDRFVAGLQIALLRDRSSNKTNKISQRKKNKYNYRGLGHFENEPVDYDECKREGHNNEIVQKSSSNNNTKRLINSEPNVHIYGQRSATTTAAVKPNNASIRTRAASLPQLSDAVNLNENREDLHEKGGSLHCPESNGVIANLKTTNITDMPPSQKKGVVFALKNLQIQQLSHPISTDIHKDNYKDIPHVNNGFSKDMYFDKVKDLHSFASSQLVIPVLKTRQTKKKESRRHTLANGIDFNMVRRMKMLEQEKDMLMQGAEVVEQAYQWYQKQMLNLQEKQKYIAQSNSYQDYSMEAHQERMNLQTARITEVNQHLKVLMESSEKGFPLHMNLALSNPKKKEKDAEHIQRIKDQNRQLTQEVGQKGERITKLEKEKVTLIRELFEAKSKLRNNQYDDTTFM